MTNLPITCVDCKSEITDKMTASKVYLFESKPPESDNQKKPKELDILYCSSCRLAYNPDTLHPMTEIFDGSYFRFFYDDSFASLGALPVKALVPVLMGEKFRKPPVN